MSRVIDSINNGGLTNDGGATNSDTNDLFGMSFNYDKPVAINGATVASLYGGNISSVSWKASTSGTTLPASTSQAYAFTYDSRDNLTTASYASVSSGGAYNVNAGKFNENISYDVMGNITYLNRNGASGTGQATIDNLTYTYYQGGSRLAKVADNAPAATRDQGFKDGTNTGPDYAYDGNGNLTQDNNKLISTTYNRLNLPVQITSGSNKIVYYYNFLGEKYKKEVYTGSTVTDTRYYLDEIEYKNKAIDFVHTSEGRALKNGTSYYYEYALTDHTGSTRVTFADRGNNGKISTEQIGAYYPYGLQYSDPNQTRMTPPQNLYTYQGNETQQDLNINLSDFNARQYDPALGRFLSHDPDDQFADLSPYAAFGNNPINNVDPSGRSFFDLAVGLAGLGAVIGGIADGSSSGKGFFAGLAAGFIAGIVGREGIGGITSIGLNLGTGGYNNLFAHQQRPNLGNSNPGMFDNFDAFGNFKGQTNGQGDDNIRIHPNDPTFTGNDRTVSLNEVDPISENHYGSDPKETIINIGNYYYKQLRLSLNDIFKHSIGIGITDRAAAFNDPGTNDLLINWPVNHFLNNSFNLKSVLFHEHLHIIKHHIGTHENELEAYYAEIQESSFQFTTDDFKKLIHDNILEEGRALGQQNPSRYFHWQRKFAKYGFDF